jgi:hypothetical protein
MVMLGCGSVLHSQGLLTTSGAQVSVNGNAKFVIRNGGFTNNGVFKPGTGEVVFSGTTTTSGSFINGTAATGFYTLVINKTSNGVQLGRNISVSNQLIFTNGDSLFLNGYNIDLGTTGSLSGETNTKRVTGRTGGYIQSTMVLNAPAGVNPGNLGLKFTSTANLGSTVIRRGHQQQVGASIYRYYDITPTVNSGLNATMDFNYFDAELAGLAEPNLGMFASDNGGTHWSNLGEDGLDQGSNLLTVNGINTLDRLTLANISAPLAVKLIRFYAEPYQNDIRLRWLTSTETNNQLFIIERSSDGIVFMEIGEVSGSGNSNQVREYQFTDQQPLPAVSWYRLRQVDVDGKNTYSAVVMINRQDPSAENARVYPNPVTGTTAYLSLTGTTSGVQQIQLYNQAGVLLRKFNVSRIAGTSVIVLETGNLTAGIYTLRQPGNAGFRLQFVKQ